MSKSILMLLMLTVVLFTAGPLVAQENVETVGLEMEKSLGQQSRQKLADGTASVGQSRLNTNKPTISLPVGIATALALTLGGSAAGVYLTRRKKRVPVDTEAPVALWLDAQKLQSDLEELETELGQQRHDNEEINSDREELLLLHADQLHELRREKEEVDRELNALRLRGGGSGSDDKAQEIIDGLRFEIEQLRGADDQSVDLRDLQSGDIDVPEKLGQQQTHINELEQLLGATHDDNSTLEQRLIGNESQLEALADTLAIRDDELDQLRKEVAQLRPKAEMLDEKQSHVSSLDEELSTLRAEMNQLLGKTGQYQALIPELETKLFHHQEQIGALESDLDATSYEAVERDREVQQWQAKVNHLQEALEAAELSNSSLESEIASVKEKNELLRRDPDTDELHQEILILRKNIEEAEVNQQQAETKLGEVELHRQRVDEWTSTVESLQAEVRRKSTLIDSQSDHMSYQEQQLAVLQTQIDELRSELVNRNEESQSLRDLLEQAGSVVVSLRDEIDGDEHDATRLRLAQNPTQDPFSQHEDSVDAIEADIEALRFSSRSRRDLADSLETILQEEQVALEHASQRVRARDEEVLTLKNDLSANRLSMVVLQSRLNELTNSEQSAPESVSMEPARVERELHQSMRVLEALRADLHKWRGRVKPLHEALVSRNERIQALEAEASALRQAQGLPTGGKQDELVGEVSNLLDRTRNGEEPEQERARTLDEMKQQWDRIVSLESDLADTGAKLARILELDDIRCRQIESLEMALSAQMARFAELRTELTARGVDPALPAGDTPGNVVDFEARRPS